MPLSAEPQRVYRFAPSPTGWLHLGHAYSAILNHDLARATGGRLLLRIEDTDVSRVREAFVEGIFTDMAWLGLEFEQPARRQTEHFADYARAADRLRGMGLIYPCYASRTEIERAAGSDAVLDPDGQPIYPGIFRDAAAARLAEYAARGEPAACRIDMAKALRHLDERKVLPLSYRSARPDGTIEQIIARPERWGDAVVVRKGTPTSYHLSVVVDDALQGVTDVVRGMDLLAATDLHRLLQALLDIDPPRYRHHPLLTTADGRKLSKSQEDKGLRELRAQGLSAEGIRRLTGLTGR